MSDNGALRVVAALTTNTADAVIATHQLWGESGMRLAELLTAAALIRETTQPARRVQAIWKQTTGNTFIADALPNGTNRGLISSATTRDGTFQVNYTLPTGQLHQGIVPVPDNIDTATAVMTYMQSSEQIITMVALAAIRKQGSFAKVGGYIIQVLPEAKPSDTSALLANLELLPPFAEILEHASDADDLVKPVLLGFPHSELARSKLEFGCTCSEQRIIMGMLTLGESELDSIVSGDALDVRCDACGKRYAIEPAAVAAMRARSGTSSEN